MADVGQDRGSPVGIVDEWGQEGDVATTAEHAVGAAQEDHSRLVGVDRGPDGRQLGVVGVGDTVVRLARVEGEPEHARVGPIVAPDGEVAVAVAHHTSSSPSRTAPYWA